jgi:hypothetical protein
MIVFTYSSVSIQTHLRNKSVTLVRESLSLAEIQVAIRRKLLREGRGTGRRYQLARSHHSNEQSLQLHTNTYISLHNFTNGVVQGNYLLMQLRGRDHVSEGAFADAIPLFQ